jgi:Tfp pilus assembly protein PilF
MSNERADDDELRANAASAEPRSRPADLRSLVAQGPLRSPAIDEDTGSSRASEEATPAFESEPTVTWPRSAITHVAPAPSPRRTPPTPTLPAPSAAPAVPPVVSGRPRRGVAAMAVATTAIGFVLLYAVSRPVPTEADPAPASSDSRPMGEHVARGQEETPLHERRPAALADRPLDIDDAETDSFEPDEEDDGEVLEIDEAELAALEASRRRAIAAAMAAKRAQAEAGRVAQEAAAALEAGRRAEAIPLFESALDLHPSLALAAAGLSSAYFDEGEFTQAVSFGERAVSIDGSNAEYHVALGDAYFRVGRTVDARSHWAIADELGSTRASKRLAKLGS